MLKSFGVIVLFGAIAFIQIRRLKRAKMKKEIWIYCVLMLLVTGTEIAKIYNWPIPNPLDLIALTLDPVNKLFSLF